MHEIEILDKPKIALCGKMRSGKDTVAFRLDIFYGLTSFKFSGGIHELVRQYFPERVGDLKDRQLLIDIGQFMRTINPDVWINYLDRAITKANTSKGIVVTDVRQENEVSYLRKLGFTIVKVVSDDEKRIERIKKSGDIFQLDQLDSVPELAVDAVDADYIIENNGSFYELQKKVDELYNWLNK